MQWREEGGDPACHGAVPHALRGGAELREGTGSTVTEPITG
jgi:hypothetical protein